MYHVPISISVWFKYQWPGVEMIPLQTDSYKVRYTHTVDNTYRKTTPTTSGIARPRKNNGDPLSVTPNESLRIGL